MLQVIQNHTGTISIKELSDKTSIKTEDIITTLQYLNLIQYQKGQHVVVAAPKVIEGCVHTLPGVRELYAFGGFRNTFRFSLWPVESVCLLSYIGCKSGASHDW